MDLFMSTFSRGFSIWRKEGSNPFILEACDIGLQGKGYQQIATNVQDYNYIDQSLDRGKSYCYRVLAHFSLGSINFPYNATTSIASNESCAELKQDIPLFVVFRALNILTCLIIVCSLVIKQTLKIFFYNLKY